MGALTSVADVFGLVQRAKSAATEFQTNFYPVERKLQAWIERGEITAEALQDVVFFFRRDRGFLHLFFCTARLDALEPALRNLPVLESERVVTDVVGRPEAIVGIVKAFEEAGFQPYSRFIRMLRAGDGGASRASLDQDGRVELATAGDSRAILDLLESLFDRYAEQLPDIREIEEAVAGGQILVARQGGEIGALLFFETQGLTTTVRYWAVGEGFRTYRLGSALMRRYIAQHSSARRFLLWVAADNDDAIAKYRHYGYVPDGLTDQILANRMITDETHS